MDQSFIDHIKSTLKKYVDETDRGNHQNAASLKDLTNDLASVLLGAQPFDDRLINRFRNEQTHEPGSFFRDVFPKPYFYKGSYPWTIDTEVVKSLVQKRHLIHGRQDNLSSSIRV